MTLSRWTVAAALAGAGVWFTCVAFTAAVPPALAASAAQDAGAPAGQPEPDAAAMAAMAEGMKRWQAACTPGKEHQQLARLLGPWDTETTMEGMGGPPMKSKGTAEFTWLFDGRWMQQSWSGSMMGMPISGRQILGYDNFRQKYTSASVNTLETTLNTSEGNFDQAGNVLITYGKMDEPMTGEVGKTVKYVLRIDSPDHLIFEVHDLAIGETNTKVVQIDYTRRK